MATSNAGASSSSSSAAPAAAVTTEKKLITLVSRDNEKFQVYLHVANQSELVKTLVEDCPDAEVYPLPNVSAAVLAKVLEYSNRHAEEMTEAELAKFDEDFVKVDQDMLFDLILAANYLNHKGLLDTTCQAVANMMKGKTPEAMRETFHIVNDYTSDEEAEVRKENSWAFE